MREKTIILIIFLSCMLLIAVLSGFVAFVLYLQQKRQIAHETKLAEERENGQKEMLRGQLEMQEQTLNHISKEIHDNIGQYISLAKLHLNTLDTGVGKNEMNIISDVDSLLATALNDLRDLSHSFSSDIIQELGLMAAIEIQTDRIRCTSGMKVDFRLEGNYTSQDKLKEIVLFRILQEAINNIIRHSEAKQITIVLSCKPENLILSIEDNGKGFDPNIILGADKIQRSAGINNMRRRASVIDADLMIEAALNRGTIVKLITANIPVSDI